MSYDMGTRVKEDEPYHWAEYRIFGLLRSHNGIHLWVVSVSKNHPENRFAGRYLLAAISKSASAWVSNSHRYHWRSILTARSLEVSQRSHHLEAPRTPEYPTVYQCEFGTEQAHDRI